MNQHNIIGRLTTDVEVRHTKDGKEVATFTLAVPRARQKDITDFVDCVIWGKGGGVIAMYRKKGDQLYVRGRNESRSYETKDGRKVKVWELKVEDFEFIGYSKRDEKRDTPPADDSFYRNDYRETDEVPY